MPKSCALAVIPGVLVVVALVLVLMLFLLKVLWAWTIPDLFPGAVQQGLIARDISWYSAFKLAIFVAVFAGIARGAGSDKRDEQ